MNRNVLQDEAGRLKVTDFGLSKIAQEKDSYGSYKMTGGTGSCEISNNFCCLCSFFFVMHIPI